MPRRIFPTFTANPASVDREFEQGEIKNFALAVVDGNAVDTANEVIERWPDGSAKRITVTFRVPRLNRQLDVHFVNKGEL